jgi:hypothetical protein
LPLLLLLLVCSSAAGVVVDRQLHNAQDGLCFVVQVILENAAVTAAADRSNGISVVSG